MVLYDVIVFSGYQDWVEGDSDWAGYVTGAVEPAHLWCNKD